MAAWSLWVRVSEEQTIEPNADRKLFDLNVVVMADVPFPGGARPQATYEIWRSAVLDGPTADPAGIFIAKLGSEYVGLTALELPESGPAITGTTGVLPEHRGRGRGDGLEAAVVPLCRGNEAIAKYAPTTTPPTRPFCA